MLTYTSIFALYIHICFILAAHQVTAIDHSFAPHTTTTSPSVTPTLGTESTPTTTGPVSIEPVQIEGTNGQHGGAHPPAEEALFHVDSEEETFSEEVREDGLQHPKPNNSPPELVEESLVDDTVTTPRASLPSQGDAAEDVPVIVTGNPGGSPHEAAGSTTPNAVPVTTAPPRAAAASADTQQPASAELIVPMDTESAPAGPSPRRARGQRDDAVRVEGAASGAGAGAAAPRVEGGSGGEDVGKAGKGKPTHTGSKGGKAVSTPAPTVVPAPTAVPPGTPGRNEAAAAADDTVVVDMGKPYRKEIVHYTGRDLPRLVVTPSGASAQKCYVKRERCCAVETACGYDCHNRWFRVCQEKRNGKGTGNCRWLNERRCYPKICVREKCSRISPTETPAPSPEVHWNVMVTKIEGPDGGSFDKKGNPL